MTFEETLAYEIGVKLAYDAHQNGEFLDEEYMEKVAIVGTAAKLLFGAARGAGSGAKNLLGFTGGTTQRTLMGATGFGLMGAASAPGDFTDFSAQGLRNKALGFTGGFLGGLAFSGAMPIAGKAGKMFNSSWRSSARGLSGTAKETAKALDKTKRELLKAQKAAGGKNATQAMKDQASALQESYKANVSAYKELMKNEGVGFMRRNVTGALGRNAGKVVGLGLGMGGGFALSGAVQGHLEKKQRPILPYQANVFNPVT